MSPLPDPRAPLEVDGPADATGVVGECTGAGALRLPGSPALAVLVMYCRMVVVGGGSVSAHATPAVAAAVVVAEKCSR